MFCHIKTRKPMLHIPLSSLDHSAQLDVTVAVGTYSNSWRIFVFADTPDTALPTVHTPAELEKFAKPEAAPLCRVSCFPNRSPATLFRCSGRRYFPQQGVLRRDDQRRTPCTAGFPTKAYADYQWKEILENAVAFCIPKNDKAVQPFLKMSRIFTTTPPPPRWP